MEKYLSLEMVRKIELMARIGMERMWKNIYPWTDGIIKINWKVRNGENVENIYLWEVW